jgi:replication initiation protein RepC
VRSMLGISPDAYEEARRAFGETGAAIVIAAILERADEIRSAGGYLRALTAKAAEGKFSLWPMLEALKNR